MWWGVESGWCGGEALRLCIGGAQSRQQPARLLATRPSAVSVGEKRFAVLHGLATWRGGAVCDRALMAAAGNDDASELQGSSLGPLAFFLHRGGIL